MEGMGYHYFMIVNTYSTDVDHEVECLMVEAALSGFRFDRLVAAESVVESFGVAETTESVEVSDDVAKAMDVEDAYANEAEAARARVEDAFYAEEAWLSGTMEVLP